MGQAAEISRHGLKSPFGLSDAASVKEKRAKKKQKVATVGAKVRIFAQ